MGTTSVYYMKKEKWGKDMTLDEAWEMGEAIGRKNLIGYLFDQCAFDKDYLYYVIEENYNEKCNKDKEL